MAGLTFDDLVPKKSSAVSFDDLVPQKQDGNAGGAGRAFAYGLSGGQVPFGNVITSGIGAGIAKAASPFTDDTRTFGELYSQAQADTKATQEANPNATLAGNVAGILSTLPAAFSKPVQGAGIIATPAKGLKSVSDFTTKMVSATPFAGTGKLAGAGNIVARMAGGAAVAAPVGGLYAAGEADAGQRGDAFLQGAGTAGAIGATLPVAGAVLSSLGGAAIKGTKNIISGIGARGEDAIGEALGAIKDSSRSLYSAADNAGVLARPDAVQPLLDDLASVVKNKDIASQRLYSNTIGAIKDLGDDIAAGNTGLMTLDRHRQILGNLAKDITNPNKAQEAEAAGRAIGFIDDFIDNLTPDKLLSGDANAATALKAARSEWAKSKRFEKIGQIIVNAANDANKLKRDLEKFRTNPKNTLGWSDVELDALKQASTQTTGEGVLKLLGKFGFDLGGGRAVGNTALPILGGLASGVGASSTGVGALVPVIGTAARSGQKALASGKAENLLKIIEQGGKVSKQMINELPSVEKNKFVSTVMKMPVAQASAILNNKASTIESAYLKQADELKNVLSQSVVDVNKPQSLNKLLGYTPRSLGQFIKENGGIQDYAGELAARDIRKQSVGLVAKGKRKVGTKEGVIEVNNNTDYVKQKSFEEGYFPNKNDYNEITDSEFYDAIAKDVGGQKIYTSKDTQFINDNIGDSDLIRQYDNVGIDYRMTKEEIAQRLKELAELDKQKEVPF